MNFRQALCLFTLAALPLAAQSRRALVVGNSDYKSLPAATLSAPSARAVARALSSSQFQVNLVINIEADALAREINKFLQDLKPADSAVFFFSGYAVQDVGENYLLPVAFNPAANDGIEFQSYSVKRLVRYLETKKLATGIVIIDPAPPSPPIERKFPEPGLASMDIRAANLVLALANLPGRATPPAPSRELSRFAEAWTTAIAEPTLSLDAALRRIKQLVSQSSNSEQVPAEISTLVNDFAFNPRSPAAQEWDRLSASTDPAALDAFRLRFPGDPLALEAAKRIESLEWTRIQAAPSPQSVRDFLARFPRHPQALQWLAANAAATAADAAANTAKDRASASAAVLAAIRNYSAAYESRDISAVIAARPSLTPAERKRLEEAFRNFKSIKYHLTPVGDPIVDPTAATVKCRLNVEMRSNDGGSPRPVEQSVTVRLHRQADAWLIDTIQ